MVEKDSESNRQKLLRACMHCDVAVARAALEAEPELARMHEGALESTPLHLAAHRGFLEIVELLLAHGAPVNAREGCSATTALHWAAEAGQTEVLEALLEHGADLTVRDSWHELTPLDWATFVVHAPHLHKDRAAAATLLELRGARASLFTGIARGDAQLVREVHARDDRAREARLGPADGESTPVLFAVRGRAAGMVDLLLDLNPAGAQSLERGFSAGALAYLAKDDATLAVLTARGVKDDLSANLVRHDWAAAQAALQRDREALLPGGSYSGLLHGLALGGLPDETVFALEHGADPNARAVCLGLDEWLAELTPLFLAASAGASEVAKRLLEHGAQVDAQAMRSRLTPLHVAAFRGRRGVVQLLLEHGADAHARDLQHDATPAEWARYAEHDELASWIDSQSPPRTHS